MMGPTQTDLARPKEPAGGWPAKLPAVVVDRRAEFNLDDLNDLMREERRSRSGWALIGVARLSITFVIGIAATLAWQPYGDAAREIIANSSPQLGWLAPPSPLPVQEGDAGLQPQPPDAMTAGFDGVRERVDRIATAQDEMTRVIRQLTSSQESIAEEVTKVREVEQYLLYKTSYKMPASDLRRRSAHKSTRRRLTSAASR